MWWHRLLIQKEENLGYFTLPSLDCFNIARMLSKIFVIQAAFKVIQQNATQRKEAATIYAKDLSKYLKEEEDEDLSEYLKRITASKIAFEQDKLEIKIVHEIIQVITHETIQAYSQRQHALKGNMHSYISQFSTYSQFSIFNINWMSSQHALTIFNILPVFQSFQHNKFTR